jgi:hypothetical protein
MNSVYEVLCSNNIETVITSDYNNNTIIKSTSDVLLIWMVWCNEEFLKTTKFENIIFFNSDPLSREKLRCMYKNVFCHPKIKLWIDYQHSNIKYLESIGRDPKTTHLIPFIWHPISTNISSILNNNVKKDIDILFYGSPNERRTAVIENLKENTNLNIQWKSGLENDDLYYNILRSKIVLVVFFYPNNRCIDFYRIAPIVYLKTHIVHEDISDLERERWIESGQEDIFKYITFCKYDNIVDKCCELLKDPEKLIELGELCYEHKKENYSLSKIFPVDKLKKMG